MKYIVALRLTGDSITPKEWSQETTAAVSDGGHHLGFSVSIVRYLRLPRAVDVWALDGGPWLAAHPLGPRRVVGLRHDSLRAPVLLPAAQRPAVP